MKEIILHIGFHKTGSSSLQATCLNNRELLEAQGFHYPLFNLEQGSTGNHGIPIISMFTEDPGNYHINVRQGQALNVEAINQSYTQQLEDILEHHERIILSGEGIASLTKMSLQRLRDHLESRGFRLRVLCLVRRPYSYTCSDLQQQIHGGSAVNFSAIRVPTKSKRVRKLKQVFPNIEYCSFEGDCAHPLGPAGALLARMGVDCSQVQFVDSNRGMGNITTRLYAHINASYPILDDRGLNQEGRDPGVVSFDDSRFLLSEQEIDSIRSQLDEENTRLGELLGEAFMDQQYQSSQEFSVDLDLALDIVSQACKPAYVADAVADFLVANSGGQWTAAELLARVAGNTELASDTIDSITRELLRLDAQ